MTTPNHADRGHARNGPSSLSRRLGCLGSAIAEEGLPDTSSVYAEEGTRAHELLEAILTNNPGDPSALSDPDMVAHVMSAVRWVHEHEAKGYTLHVEVPLDPGELLGPETWGTADIVLVKAEHIIVADFKYGQGMEVFPEKNLQLIAYAAGAALMERADAVKYELPEPHFTLAILQPRLRSGATIKTFPMSLPEIQVEWDRIAAELTFTYSATAPRTPTDSGCHWCKAKGDCPARLDAAQAAITTAFEDAGVSHPQAPVDALQHTGAGIGGLSDGMLTGLLDLRGMIDSVLKDVQDEIFSRIRRGEPVDGYKIVAGNRSRAWKHDADELARLFKNRKIKVADYMVTKMGSPAYVEKIATLTDKQRENISTLWEFKQGSEKLVVSSASGESLYKDPGEAFAAAAAAATPEPEPPLSFL